MRQAMRLASGVPVSLGAWRHGVLCQAVTRKQWGLGGRWSLAGGEYRQAVWNSFAWWRVGRARRKHCCSLLGVLFLTDNDALLGSGDAVP